MAVLVNRCPVCGGEVEKLPDGRYVCPNDGLFEEQDIWE